MSDRDPDGPPERYRYCVFCGADCHLEDPPHRDDCPQVTGVYPVRREDVFCHGCGVTFLGMRCTRCEAELDEGDFYALLEVEPGVNEVVCLGCAATAALGAG